MARSQRVGDDHHDLVHLYLSDVGRRALLTKDDEARLAKLIEAGGGARPPPWGSGGGGSWASACSVSDGAGRRRCPPQVRGGEPASRRLDRQELPAVRCPVG